MKYIPAIILIMSAVVLQGQTNRTLLTGQVSFVSTENVYVRFKSTAGISAGDTLFIRDGKSLAAALVVKDLSSASCACAVLNDKKFSVGEQVIAVVDRETSIKKDEPDESRREIAIKPVIESDTLSTRRHEEVKQVTRGSISLNSYSDFSDAPADDIHRFRYTLSLGIQNISKSRFSIESYISFRHRAGTWDEVRENVFNALKIYSLALRYDIDRTTQIVFGRKINHLVSSIGPVDGLQIQKTFNRFTAGVLIGSRPDYQTFGFNTNLFQYGSFIAYKSGNPDLYSESSAAFMQQMNNGHTDRRFLYFQHSNSLSRDLSFLGTMEVDLYKLETDTAGSEKALNDINLTGLYMSVSYRPLKALGISASYDARRNVIYYETYKTYVERLLENDLRQGFRLSGTYRISGMLTSGLQTGYRYLKSDPRPSKNLYSYLTASAIPAINISATASATLLESGFLKGMIFSLNISKEFFKGKLQSGAGYRYADFSFAESTRDINQNVAEIYFSLQAARKIHFSVNYEGTFEKPVRYDRLYIQFRKRF